MTARTVHSRRTFTADADALWNLIGGFDLAWHPQVASCTLLRTANGTLMREFQDTNGNPFREERTYVSDSDRVLCYRLIAGIDGIIDYRARVQITEQPGAGCRITWQAEVAADPARLGAISDGTLSIFETGLDALEKLPKQKTRRHRKPAFFPAETGRRTVEGSPRLSLLTAGANSNNTLVLFLHGIGGQASNWTQQLKQLGSRFTVAAMDLRGYGKSTAGDRRSTVEDYCADILRTTEAFGADRLVLVGLSYGSWIATGFAMRHGDKLAGLVLAGGCTGLSEAGALEREAFHKARRVPLDQGQTPADFAPSVVDIVSGPKITNTQKDSLRESMAAIPAETYRDALNCFCNPPETFDFRRISCPVLLLTGEHDRLAPPEEIRQVATRLHDAASTPGRDVRFEVIADAGHICNLEQSERFNSQLTRFLSRLPGIARDDRPSPAEKQHIKRDRILQAAHAEFCRSGFDGTSMDRLASAAGVSKPTLYQYFGDKEGLLAAVLDVARRHLIAPLAAPDGTLVERLWEFSWTYADFVLRPDMLSLARLILGEAARRPDSAVAYHASGPGKAFAGIVGFIEDAVRNGELTVDDADLAANDLWSLILSGPRDYYLHHVDAVPDRDHLLRSIGHGLRVFLTVYSTRAERDLAELQAKFGEAVRSKD